MIGWLRSWPLFVRILDRTHPTPVFSYRRTWNSIIIILQYIRRDLTGISMMIIVHLLYCGFIFQRGILWQRRGCFHHHFGRNSIECDGFVTRMSFRGKSLLHLLEDLRRRNLVLSPPEMIQRDLFTVRVITHVTLSFT